MVAFAWFVPKRPQKKLCPRGAGESGYKAGNGKTSGRG